MKIIKLTQYEKGFLEGLIDSEGCICLYKNKTRYNTITTIPSLTISNINLKFLLKAKKIVKYGTIKQQKLESGNIIYEYNISPNGMRYLLPSLKLIVKEQDRKNILKVLKILDKKHGGFGKWNPNYKKSELIKLYKKLRHR